MSRPPIYSKASTIEPTSPTNNNGFLHGNHQRRGATVRALVLVNCQNDFFVSENGATPVPDAKQVIKKINTQLRPRKFDVVIITKQMRSSNDLIFSSNNPGTKHYELEHFSRHGAQKMMPDFCVRGTRGSNLVSELIVDPSDLIVETSTNPHPSSSTSNSKGPPRRLGIGGATRTRKVDLGTILSNERVTDVYLAGLPTEFIASETVRTIRTALKSVNIWLTDATSYMQKVSTSVAARTAQDQLKRQWVTVVSVTGPEINRIPLRKSLPQEPPSLTVEVKDSSTGTITSTAKDKVTVANERDEYYGHFFEEYDDDFGMVNFLFDRKREQRRHVRSIFPPLPNIKTLKLLGLGNPYRLHEQQEPTGMNAIHACCACGDNEMLSLLLEYDTPPHGTKQLDLQSSTTMGYDTPLQLAVMSKHNGCTRMLIQQKTARGRSININWSRSVHPTALMMSCNQCDFPVVKSFLQQPGRANTRGQDKYKKTALMYACEHNTDASVAIIAEILSGEANFAARKSLLEMTDVCKWSSLHYAARSGVLARFPWNLLGGETRALNELKTDAVTEIGISLIHIASWNGHNDVLRLLLNHGSIPLADLGYRVDDESGVATKFIPNNLTTKRLTELDLALKAHHIDCARTLCGIKFPYAGAKGGFKTHQMNGGAPGKAAQRLLERAALGCDLSAVEGILRWDQNKVRITRPLVEMTRKMKYLDTCTFTFAAYSSPMRQPMWHCGHCNVKACIVCRFSCHTSPECIAKLQWQGDDKDEYCECSINTGTCCALKNADKKNLKYVPKPVNTESVNVPKELEATAEMIAINIHEVWSAGYLDKGWRYHATRNNEALLHNCLVPYWELEEQDKKYDLETAFGSIRLILALGYTMRKKTVANGDETEEETQRRKEAIEMMMQDSDGSGSAGERRRARKVLKTGEQLPGTILEGDESNDVSASTNSNESKGEQGEEEDDTVYEYVTYDPHPLDTSALDVTPEIQECLEAAAKNCHEVWALSKMNAGFKHATEDAIRKAQEIYEGHKRRVEETNRRIDLEYQSLKTNADTSTMTKPDPSPLPEKPLLSHILVPYEDLSDEDKEKNRDTVRAAILTSMFLGFTFEPPIHEVDLGALSRHNDHVHEALAISTTTDAAALTTTAAATAAKTTAVTESEDLSSWSSGRELASDAIVNNREHAIIKTAEEEDEEAAEMEHMRQKEQMEIKKRSLLDMYLHAAARHNDPDMIDFLLLEEDRAAQVDAKDQFDHYPLYMAVKRGHMPSIIKLLERGADPTLTDLQGFSSLHLAAYLGNLPAVKALVSGHLTSGNYGTPPMDPTTADRKHRLTPLHIAAYKGHVAVCTFLAKEMSGPGKRGVDVWWGQGEDKIGKNKRKSGLWRKSFGGGSQLGSMSSDIGGSRKSPNNNNDNNNNGPSAYAVTLDDNASQPGSVPNSPMSGGRVHNGPRWIDPNGIKLPQYSPLAVAVKGHQPRVCKVLVDHDANPDVIDGTGKKPYDRALRLHYHLKETVSTLTAGRELSDMDGEKEEIKRETGLFQTGGAICGCFKTFRRVEIKVDQGRGGAIRRKQSVVTSESSKYPSPFLYTLCCCCRDYFAAPIEEATKSPIRKVRTFRRSSLVTLNDPHLDAVRSQANLNGTSHLEAALKSLNERTQGADALSDMQKAVASLNNDSETKTGQQHHAQPRARGRGSPQPLRSDTKTDPNDGSSVTLTGRGSRSTRTLAIARVTKNRDKAGVVLSELERSKVVDARRCLFAFRTCITGLLVWIPILALFYLLFTPVSVWYPTTHVFDLTHYLETTLDTSIQDYVVDQSTWYDWHQKILLGVESTTNYSISDRALLKPWSSLGHVDGATSGTGTSTSNITYLLSENIVLGPISIVGIRAVPTPCAYPSGMSWDNPDALSLSDLVCYAPLDTEAEWTTFTYGQNAQVSTHPVALDAMGGGHLLPVNSGDVQTSHAMLNELRTNLFISDSTRLVMTSINTYNPHLQIFTSISIRAEFMTTGAVDISVSVESAHLHPTFPTFPPSVLFAVFLGVGGVAIMIRRILAEKRNRRCSSFTTTQEWARYSIEILFTHGIFVIILALVPYSLSLRNQIETLNLLGRKPDSNIYVDLRLVINRFRNMMDWLSVVSMILWMEPFTILKQAPMIGPMVVAVIDTIGSQDVILYIFIFAFFLLLFSMSFQIAYGTELAQFTKIDTALFALFKMPFAEEWQNLDTPKARLLTTIYWILFLILSVLLLNLLIAIVTQVYPEKLELSEDVWKATITESMQLQLRLEESKKKNNDGNKGGRSPRTGNRNRRNGNRNGNDNDGQENGDDDEDSITLAECLNKQLILEGFDGYNFWRGNNSSDGNLDNEDRTSTDQEEHVFGGEQDDGMGRGSDAESLLAGLASGSASRANLVQLMAAVRGSGGNVNGDAWQKMENALKDQQEKFTMMQAKMKALDDTLEGVVEMARETLTNSNNLMRVTAANQRGKRDR